MKLKQRILKVQQVSRKFTVINLLKNLQSLPSLKGIASTISGTLDELYKIQFNLLKIDDERVLIIEKETYKHILNSLEQGDKKRINKIPLLEDSSATELICDLLPSPHKSALKFEKYDKKRINKAPLPENCSTASLRNTLLSSPNITPLKNEMQPSEQAKIYMNYLIKLKHYLDMLAEDELGTSSTKIPSHASMVIRQKLTTINTMPFECISSIYAAVTQLLPKLDETESNGMPRYPRCVNPNDLQQCKP